MDAREAILVNIWSRLSKVDEMNFTARNPSRPPKAKDLPAALLFDFPDDVVKVTKRGDYPSYTRDLTVVIEVYITATSEESSSKELTAFMKKVKTELYRGGPTFGKRCQWEEIAHTRILRPAAGENMVGIGTTIRVVYLEHIASLF